ncbi:pantoate--beta-alanine ligase [Pareuzebyella sediminis]|uniref:pantoate--beta-alanine ligase n=1 Tax=Pareuzebyella sediminis TaxID=2607998 RepID=UPI0011EDB267|nr:pantoate--beta-alanine ligase [Pareuzebyella sediminis]
MKIFHTKEELTKYLFSTNIKGNLALVPTMGALHDGHKSLVERAKDENTVVVVSIFVNPTQFDNQDDLKKYPKTLDADLDLLHGISDEILVFAPSIDEIYDHNVKPKTYDFEGLDKVMEGAFREDHFNGVGTIVELLFLLVRPDRAYFGEKDFQQLQIIKKLVKKLELPVKVVGCPIVREPHGLALSSRNKRLTKTQHEKASFIYQTLNTAKSKFGTKSAYDVKVWVEAQFEKNPHFKLEYFEITDAETLTPIQKKKQNLKYRAFIAVYAGKIRLIDNVAL